MENILVLFLVAFMLLLCSGIAILNFIRRRSRAMSSQRNLESLKKQGIITDEEFESIKASAGQRIEASIESCAISAEEMREAIDAALRPVNELERDESYAGNPRWAEALGIHSSIELSLKELTFLSMKVGKSRDAIDLLAEILSMNVSVDALEAAQNRGKMTFPNYRLMARVIWVRARQRLSEHISIQKEIHEQRKLSEQALLTNLIPIIMKALEIPVNAAGFAAMLALIAAKIDFGAFSEEDEDNPDQS